MAVSLSFLMLPTISDETLARRRQQFDRPLFLHLSVVRYPLTRVNLDRCLDYP